MTKYTSSRLLPTFFIAVVVIVAVIGIVALTRLVFFSNQGASQQSQADKDHTALLDTSSGSAVSMTVRGPIVANEDFRSYKIIVSPNERDMKTYTGYLNTVLKQENLSNNVAAYEEFVHALYKAGILVKRQLPSNSDDFRGVCATGKLYVFSILKDNKSIVDVWASTCSSSSGSLRASTSQLSQLSQLFQKQIPSATDLLRGLSL